MIVIIYLLSFIRSFFSEKFFNLFNIFLFIDIQRLFFKSFGNEFGKFKFTRKFIFNVIDE